VADIILVAGLGNIGDSYKKNRHNAGFLFLDALSESMGAGNFKTGLSSSALINEISFTPGNSGASAIKVVMIKPQQFMNRSGEAVAKAMQFYKVKVSQLIVAHDEIELPFGTVKLKMGGGHKGHNGIRDIIEKCGSADFARIRLGVGRPAHSDVASYVLSDFSKAEQAGFDQFFIQAELLLKEKIAEIQKN
jgi:PTH1 family peptidyl-tRNA hydrolase